MRHLTKIVLIVLLGVASLATFAQGGTTSVVGGDEEQLREFVARYLGAYAEDDVIVRIGDVPEGFALPLPEGARVLASIARQYDIYPTPRNAEDSTFVEIFLTNSPTPRAVYDFYQAQASANNWDEISVSFSPPAGFNPTSSAYGNYCLNDGSISFSYDVYSPESGRIFASVRYQEPADEYMCMTMPYPPYEDPTNVIPALSVPPNTTLNSNLGGSAYYGMDVVSIAAALSSELSLTEIASHYNGELIGADWTQISEDIGQRSVTSIWRLTSANGLPYSAMMVITQPGEGDYRALIMVEPTS